MTSMKYLHLLSLIALLSYRAHAGWTWISGFSSPQTWITELGVKNVTADYLYTSGMSFHNCFMYQNRMYITGGYHYNEGSFADNVWWFQPAGGLWTWFGGAGTAYADPIFGFRRGVRHGSVRPGGRAYTSSFIDGLDGRLYIFGGVIRTSQVTNSMFSFDFLALQYTWIGGEIDFNSVGNYGTKGIDSPQNNIPAIYAFPNYYDQDQRCLYVFGGLNVPPGTSTINKLSSTWRYNMTTGNWTWLHGPQTANQKGDYGIFRQESPESFPGGRGFSAYAADPVAKLLYVFGGTGFGGVDEGEGALNDLWVYSIHNNTWKWIAGTKDYGAAGFPGDKNVYHRRNNPKARFNANIYIDRNKNALYLYGGAKPIGNLNEILGDVWKFSLEYYLWAFIAGTIAPNYGGNFGRIGVKAATNSPPGLSAYCNAFNRETGTWYIHGGQIAPSGVMNHVWEFVDDYPEQSISNSEDSTTIEATLEVVTSTRASVNPDRITNRRPQFVYDESNVSEPLSPVAIVLIAAGIGLVVVLTVLIFLRYVRRQSVKEAIIANMPETDASSVLDKSVVESVDQGPKKGSSTIDLKSIVVPSPIVVYSFNAVEKAKEFAPKSLEINGEDFDAVQQIGTQNGVPIYNGIYKGSGSSSMTEKATIKIYGVSSQQMKPNVEDAFWKEVELLKSLEDAEGITKMLFYSTDPFAILFPHYKLGNLEHVITNNVRTLSSADVFNIVKGVCLGLKALHEKNISHRNLKLRNVMIDVDSTGAIKAYLAAFYALQQTFYDDDAVAALPQYRIDAKNANFVAPEVFMALKGDVPRLNSTTILLSGDLFSLAILISKLMKVMK